MQVDIRSNSKKSYKGGKNKKKEDTSKLIVVTVKNKNIPILVH